MSGLQPVSQGGNLGFFDLCLCWVDCAMASNAPPNDKPKARINATRARGIGKQNNTVFREEPQKGAACVRLVMARRRSVRVIAEGVRVPFGQDFHHPAIKVIDGVIHDRFEAPVVLSMSFFYVVFQSHAKIFVLAAQAHLLRPEHFYILHGNFGYAICAAMQFLFLGGEAVHVKFIPEFLFRAAGRGPRFDQFDFFRFRMQLHFRGYRLWNDRHTMCGRSRRRLGGPGHRL